MLIFYCRNHLADILCHEVDFGLKVESDNFFATSHGKTVSDGVGGTIKRTVMGHSLRSPPDQQITNALKMFEFASAEIKTIR